MNTFAFLDLGIADLTLAVVALVVIALVAVIIRQLYKGFTARK